jgi:hypothetical protein
MATETNIHNESPGVSASFSPWALALCFRDQPIPVNQAPEKLPLSHQVEWRCRAANVTCLVDTLNLRPERSMRSLLRPVPRIQDVVTTVWPDEECLRRVLGKSGEAEEGGELLGGLNALPHALFWVPRYSIPTLKDAEKRIARKEAMGPGSIVGDLGHVPPLVALPPENLQHPAADLISRHEQRLQAEPRLGRLQYDRRAFESVENTANGDVQPGLEFHYHEYVASDGSGLVWAFYEGAGVELGMLVALKESAGRLRMSYQHLSDTDLLRTGHCFSYPEIGDDGTLRMHEFWRWTAGDLSAGQSLLREKPGVTIERRVS